MANDNGYGGLFGGLGGMGMGGIIPMLMQGKSMSLIPMLMGQGNDQGGQQQDQGTQQQPVGFLNQAPGNGFLGGMPSLADYLQGRIRR
jgi:hypothetical protein